MRETVLDYNVTALEGPLGSPRDDGRRWENQGRLVLEIARL
jgi:hypothetical protein